MAISSNTTGLRPGVCTSTSRPSSPYEGQSIYQTDTDTVLFWNGSAWVAPYATTASPVFTGTPTAPTAAAGTNTTQIATMASKPWNTAWGTLSLTTRTTSITIAGGTVILTSPTFNGVSGRLYKITHYQSVAYNTGAGYTIMYIRNNGSAINESYMPNRAASEPSAFAQFYIGTLPTSSNVITVYGISTNVTPTNNSATAPSYLLIEDIGPA